MAQKGDLLSFRPDIKVLDATIRDGGLVNDFYFTDEFIKALYKVNVKAGVDYMEFGYRADKEMFDVDKFGKWKFCDDDDIRAIVGDNDTDLKISIMADVGRCNYKQDILIFSKSLMRSVPHYAKSKDYRRHRHPQEKKCRNHNKDSCLPTFLCDAHIHGITDICNKGSLLLWNPSAANCDNQLSKQPKDNAFPNKVPYGPFFLLNKNHGEKTNNIGHHKNHRKNVSPLFYQRGTVNRLQVLL